MKFIKGYVTVSLMMIITLFIVGNFSPVETQSDLHGRIIVLEDRIELLMKSTVMNNAQIKAVGTRCSLERTKLHLKVENLNYETAMSLIKIIKGIEKK